ncbi:MAG: hypothetical protein ACQESD_00795 [Thermoplasmatota archaeon]
MDSKGFIYALIVWFTFGIASAILVAIREGIFDRLLGVEISKILVTIILISFILFMTYILLHKTDIVFLEKDLLAIGVLWLVMTLVFELLFGRFVLSGSLEFFAADYDIIRGKLWTLVLLTQLLAPIGVDMIERY